jgi:hypothetical protein
MGISPPVAPRGKHEGYGVEGGKIGEDRMASVNQAKNSGGLRAKPVVRENPAYLRIIKQVHIITV